MPPLDVTGVRTIAVGTSIWIVVGLVSLVLRSRLEATGNEWWLWTCAVGIGLGFVGFLYCLSYRKRMHRLPRQVTVPPGLP